MEQFWQHGVLVACDTVVEKKTFSKKKEEERKKQFLNSGTFPAPLV